MTELNEQIYARAKLVCDKIGVPIKSTNRNSKPGGGNSLGNADKKSTTSKNYKTEEER